MKAIPTVQKYMTTTPHTIGDDQSVAAAAAMMSEYHIRHLPVLHGGKVVGIISDRDVNLVSSLREVDVTTTKIADAMVLDPYCVRPDAPLDEVATAMAEHKYGSVIVADHGKVVGIFTAVDGLRTLAELLHTRLK